MTVAEHIFYRHGPTVSGFDKPTSRYALGTTLRDVRDFINEAVARGTMSGNGVTYDFGRVIGTDVLGNPATRLQV